MKITYKLFGMLLLFSLVFAGCSKETEVNQGGGAEPAPTQAEYAAAFQLKGVSVGNDVKTYAPVPAKDFEKNLSSLAVLLFNPADKKYIGTVDATFAVPTGNTEAKITAKFDAQYYAGASGADLNVEFVLIGNMTKTEVEAMLEKVKADLSLPALSDLTYTQIKEKAVVTKANDAPNRFVMLMNEAPVAVTLKKGLPQDIAANLTLKRLSAKINVVLEGAGLTGIALKNAEVVQPRANSNLYVLSPSWTPQGTVANNVVDMTGAGGVYTEKIYTYENSVAGNTSLILNLTLNGVALKPLAVPFATAAGNIAVERNKIYTVKLKRDPGDNPEQPTDPNVNPPKFTWTIDVYDWNIGGTQIYEEDYANAGKPVVTNIAGVSGNAVTAATPWESATIAAGSAATVFIVETDSKSSQVDAVVDPAATWLTKGVMTMKTYGAMQQVFSFSAALNNTNADRTTKIKFFNKLDETKFTEVTVTQKKHEKVSIGTTYTLSVNPASLSFAIAGGTQTVTVTADKVEKFNVNGVYDPTQDITTPNLPFTVSLSGSSAITQTTSGNTISVSATTNTGNIPHNVSLTVTITEAPANSKIVAITQAAQPPKMALEYVAQYNIGTTSGVFANSHANATNGFYSWSGATNMTMPSGYHLPSKEEWAGIIPVIRDDNVKVIAWNNSSYDNNSEVITVANTTNTYTADYRTVYSGDSYTTYALRFKNSNDNSRLSAWRYEYIPYGGIEPYGERKLKITCRYLGPEYAATVTVGDIAKESYWSNNTAHDVVRYFSMPGGMGDNWQMYNVGILGLYMSSTKDTRYYGTCWGMITNNQVSTVSGMISGRGSVRLFADN